MTWDLIAVDINKLGILAAKGLAEELSRYREYDQLVPRSLLPSLRPVLKYEDRFYFAPFRPNVKVVFYNKRKFAQYGLKPPNNWDQLLEVARVFKKEEGVGRVAIQGHPGEASAVTVFEFVKAAGGNTFALDDEGSKRAFTFLRQLEPYLAPEYAETRFDTANHLLIDDAVYLASNWTYGVKIVIEDAGKKGIGVYSGWKGPERKVHVLGGDVLALPTGAPHPSLSIKLMELLLSKQTQETFVSRLRWLPVRLDAYGAVPAELFQAANDALSFSIARPTIPQWPMVENELDRAFQRLVVEGDDIGSLQQHSASLKRIPPAYGRYRVNPGDTLGVIAQLCNTSVEMLAEANDISIPKSITPGQILLIPQDENTPPCAVPSDALRPLKKALPSSPAPAQDRKVLARVPSVEAAPLF